MSQLGTKHNTNIVVTAKRNTLATSVAKVVLYNYLYIIHVNHHLLYAKRRAIVVLTMKVYTSYEYLSTAKYILKRYKKVKY